MSSRIDAVKIKLFAYDEFEGTRYVEFDVPVIAQDDPFIVMVQQKWQEYSNRVIAQAKNSPPGDVFI